MRFSLICHKQYPKQHAKTGAFPADSRQFRTFRIPILAVIAHPLGTRFHRESIGPRESEFSASSPVSVGLPQPLPVVKIVPERVHWTLAGRLPGMLHRVLARAGTAAEWSSPADRIPAQQQLKAWRLLA